MDIKVCSVCKDTKSIDEFAFKNKAAGTRASNCKECQNKKNKSHYENNKSAYSNKNVEIKIRNREWLIEYKNGKKCVKCGESHPACLTFHHRDPNEKEFNIGQVSTYSIERMIKEIEKCDIMCFNCHMKLHWAMNTGQHNGMQQVSKTSQGQSSILWISAHGD